MTGIVSYGAWIPFLRISVDDIVKIWDNTGLSKVKEGHKLTERAVLQPNEDSNTMAVAAARRAIAMAGGSAEDIDGVFLGTCTNPYDTRASVTVIEEALGLKRSVISSDLQFGGKSGTTGMQLGMALIGSGMAKQVLAVGSDTINRHTAPGVLHETAASAGAMAVILGSENVIAEIKGTASYSSDLTDFFRIEGDRYIQDNGAGGQPYPEFEIGMMAHIKGASDTVMNKLGCKPEDFDFAVFQQPYGSVPYIVGERLGFTEPQVTPGVISDKIGDCGSASAMLGLAHVLDNAKPGQKIFLAAYGFGAGADAFVLTVTDEIAKVKPKKTIADLLAYKRIVSYADAIRYEYKYMQELQPFYQ